MVNIINLWHSITGVAEMFTWFILGYALRAIGFGKMFLLFVMFFAMHWFWNHWAIISKATMITGGEG